MRAEQAGEELVFLFGHPGTQGSWLWRGSGVGEKSPPSCEGEAEEAVFAGARLGLLACSRLPSTSAAGKGSSCALKSAEGLLWFFLF